MDIPGRTQRIAHRRIHGHYLMEKRRDQGQARDESVQAGRRTTKSARRRRFRCGGGGGIITGSSRRCALGRWGGRSTRWARDGNHETASSIPGGRRAVASVPPSHRGFSNPIERSRCFGSGRNKQERYQSRESWLQSAQREKKSSQSCLVGGANLQTRKIPPPRQPLLVSCLLPPMSAAATISHRRHSAYRAPSRRPE